MRNIKLTLLEQHFSPILKVFAYLATLLLIYSSYLIFNAPEDYLQGIYAKIMYIHVPMAWLSVLLYVAVAGAALCFLIFKNPVFDMIAYAIAPIGLIYTLATLVTGAIWGKPTWGAWWVWDARLTSMLILFFIYFGYIALRSSHTSEERSATVSSLFAIIGLLNIPIIKFSVYLWNTLHQKSSIFSTSGISIHSSLLIPLVTILLFFIFFTCILITLRIVNISYRRRSARLKLFY